MIQCNCWENRNWCKKKNAISCHTSLLYVPWCLCLCYCVFQRQSSFYAFSVPICVQLISQISNRDLQHYENDEYVFKYFMEPNLIEHMPRSLNTLSYYWTVCIEFCNYDKFVGTKQSVRTKIILHYSIQQRPISLCLLGTLTLTTETLHYHPLVGQKKMFVYSRGMAQWFILSAVWMSTSCVIIVQSSCSFFLPFWSHLKVQWLRLHCCHSLWCFTKMI